jgi:hypothetical protein
VTPAIEAVFGEPPEDDPQRKRCPSCGNAMPSFLQQIGQGARAELLAALTAPEEERAARIGRARFV